MSRKKNNLQRKRSKPYNNKNKKKIFKRHKTLLTILAAIILLSIIFTAFMVFFNEEKTNPIATIETSKGSIKVELYKDKLPNTVKNFVKLAKNDFYQGLVFHRVIDGFMIQGGGFTPDGDKKESPYGSIDLETHPDVKHIDGTISMARTSGDPNSATNQFFICDGPQSHLDGSYAAFGKVVEGMKVVRNISSVETTSKYGHSDWPKENIEIIDVKIKD
ncbi:MAG: peptidylprolyl isomerase [Candidatus Thermoplasmatota archaeon]